MSGDASQQVLDWQGLLERTGDEALAHELAAIMLSDLPNMQTAIAGALQAQDATAVQRAAHGLKGALANFTCGPAFTAAASLEALGRAGDLQGAVALHAALLDALQRFAVALRQVEAPR